MKPSPKHPQIERYLETMTGRTTAIESYRCISSPFGCGRAVNLDDYSELERREYSISGLCSKCQGKIFGGNEDE